MIYNMNSLRFSAIQKVFFRKKSLNHFFTTFKFYFFFSEVIKHNKKKKETHTIKAFFYPLTQPNNISHITS